MPPVVAVDSVVGAVRSAVNKGLMTPALTDVWAATCPQPHDGFPYMVVKWPSTKFQWTFESTYVEKPQIILEIYHTDLGPAEAGMRRILRNLKDQDLPLLNDRSLQFFPIDMYGGDEPSLSAGSNVIFKVTGLAEVWISRSR